MKRARSVGHSPTREDSLRQCPTPEQLSARIQQQRALLQTRIEQEQLALSQRLPLWRSEQKTWSEHHLDAVMLIPLTMHDLDPFILFSDVHDITQRYLEKQFQYFGPMKVQLAMKLLMILPEKEIEWWVNTKLTALLDATEITSWLQSGYAYIISKIEKFV
jgi:hypothetical protein